MSKPIRWALITVALLGIAGWLAFRLLFSETVLSFTQDEIQSRLSPRFPLEKCALGTLCLKLTDPNVILKDGADRLGCTGSFTASYKDVGVPGKIAFDGMVRYADGKFFFDDVQISEFELTGLAPKWSELVTKHGPKIAQSILVSVPIYSLDKHPKYGQLAKLALRDVKVADGRLQVTLVAPTAALASARK
jgi:Protein of unknown function (DUF1439)